MAQRINASYRFLAEVTTLGKADGTIVPVDFLWQIAVRDILPVLRESGFNATDLGSFRQAGLEAGDVIVAFDGSEVTDLYAYSYALREKSPGDVVSVTILRDGQRLTFRAVLGDRR